MFHIFVNSQAISSIDGYLKKKIFFMELQVDEHT